MTAHTEAEPIVAAIVQMRIGAQITGIDHWRRKTVIVIFVVVFFLIFTKFLHSVDLLYVFELLHEHPLLLALPQDAILADLQLA